MPHQVRRTRQSAEAARNGHNQIGITLDRATCIPCRFRILPNHAYLIAKGRAGDDEPVDNQGDKSEKNADINFISERIEQRLTIPKNLVIEACNRRQCRIGWKSNSLGSAEWSCTVGTN